VADTIDEHHHHEPPPPTIRDGEPLPPTQQEPVLPSRSGARPFVVWAAVLLSALLLSGAAAWAYFGVYRYEAIARHHVPGNAQIVLRLELAQLALYAPIREKLLPALEERLGQPAAGQAGKSLRERVDDATGIDLGRDVREVVLATVEGKEWVLIAAGKIPRGRFVAGLARVLEEEKTEGFHRVEEMLVGPDGLAFGQSEDGALIVGTSVNVVRAALPIDSGSPTLVLPEGALVFAMTRDAAEVSFGLPRDQVRMAQGSLSLGDAPSLGLSFELVPGADPESVARSFAASLVKARPLFAKDPEAAAIFDGTTVSPAPDAVHVTFPWTVSGLTKTCEGLAERVRTEALGANLLPAVAR
jgi:hypothetical protein